MLANFTLIVFFRSIFIKNILSKLNSVTYKYTYHNINVVADFFIYTIRSRVPKKQKIYPNYTILTCFLSFYLIYPNLLPKNNSDIKNKTHAKQNTCFIKSSRLSPFRVIHLIICLGF